MQLNDLFVSYKQVDPVEFNPIHVEDDLFLNLNRAKQATAESTSETSTEEPVENSDTSTDMSSWKVNEAASSSNLTAPSSTVKTTISEPANNNTSKALSRWSSPYKNNKNLWVSDMIAAYKRQGLSDNAIKNLLAKNALESGWGSFAQGNWNFGNITTGNHWSGKYVSGKDHNATGNIISQAFRAYDSLDDYVKDEIQFLTRLYDFNQNDSIDQFLGKLQGNNSGKRRYAEARDYTNSVKRVYNSI